ncbi:MAG: type secretion system secreted protein Hcp [Thermoanaerobaculia bacterium]|jgi:type VI secretion system secreted protein Hcp|nr:type secretion system secreted protein Hcp [Thermoanaerobaculia bacterium]
MAINAYMKLDKIDGDCTAGGHEKEIEVLNWNHGFVQPTSATRSAAGGGTVEQASHQPLSISKYIDSATTVLMKTCWSGKTIATAVLSCFRASGAEDNKSVEYLKVEMTDVIISNQSLSGGGGDLPVENLTLDYGTVQYTYVLQKDDGTAGGNKPAKHDLMKKAIS